MKILPIIQTLIILVGIGMIEGSVDCDNETRFDCCSSELEKEPALMKCVLLFQSKLPTSNNPAEAVKFLSCLVDCLYKTKKYMGKGDSLNLKFIKDDINEKYKDNPKQAAFYYDKMAYCQDDGKSNWDLLKRQPAAKLMFKGACKPYFLFVFLCAFDYETKVKCPSFKWSKGETCIADAKECLK